MNTGPELRGALTSPRRLDAIAVHVSRLNFAEDDEQLDAGTEWMLAQFIQEGRAARALPDTDDQAEQDRRNKAVADGKRAGTLLLEANWRWAYTYADQFEGQAGSTYDDEDDVGRVALLRLSEAAETYEPTLEHLVSFRAYARPLLHRALSSYVSYVRSRGELQFVSLEIEAGYHPDIDRLVEAPDPEEIVANRAETFHPMLRRIFEGLTPPTREVALRRLLPPDPPSLNEVAMERGITPESARDREARAKQKGKIVLAEAAREGILNPLRVPADRELDVYPRHRRKQQEEAAAEAVVESEYTLGDILKAVIPHYRKDVVTYLQEVAERWGEELLGKLAEAPPPDPTTRMTGLIHPRREAQTIDQAKHRFMDALPNPHYRLEVLQACRRYLTEDEQRSAPIGRRTVNLLHRLRAVRYMPKPGTG